MTAGIGLPVFDALSASLSPVPTPVKKIAP
jgi:hypothetical protein